MKVSPRWNENWFKMMHTFGWSKENNVHSFESYFLFMYWIFNTENVAQVVHVVDGKPETLTHIIAVRKNGFLRSHGRKKARECGWERARHSTTTWSSMLALPPLPDGGALPGKSGTCNPMLYKIRNVLRKLDVAGQPLRSLLDRPVVYLFDNNYP